MIKVKKSEMIESKVGSTLTDKEKYYGLTNDGNIFIDVTLKKGNKEYTMRREVNDPRKMFVLLFFRRLCNREYSEQERDEIYFNYVVPFGLQSYVTELINEMEDIIKNN